MPDTIFAPADRTLAEDAADAEEMVVPVVADVLIVETRPVVTGRVRVTKTVTEHEEVVDEPLARTRADVKTVPVNQFVDEAPPPRREGDTWIVPVVEEVLVRRLRVVEEIHITDVRTEYRDPQTIRLRREHVSVEYLSPPEATAAEPGPITEPR